MNRRVVFWLLFLLGMCIFAPYFYFSIRAQIFLWAIMYLGVFVAYCFFLYRFVYRKAKTKYPIVPPEGRMDAYFPRTDIPRPVYEDVDQYPEFFKKKKKRKYQRTRRVKKKT